MHPIDYWRGVFHRSNLPNENEEFCWGRIWAVQSCSRQIWPLQERPREWRGGDKDKIAGTGFNKTRRLADEKSGERRKKSSEEIYKAATRSISDGESFWHYRKSYGI
jgi:hypothetical protein